MQKVLFVTCHSDMIGLFCTFAQLVSLSAGGNSLWSCEIGGFMAPMTILLYWKGIVDASGARTCQVVQLGWNTVGQVVGSWRKDPVSCCVYLFMIAWCLSWQDCKSNVLTLMPSLPLGHGWSGCRMEWWVLVKEGHADRWQECTGRSRKTLPYSYRARMI